ncbi:hypothetical protein ACVWU4_001006 [Campylobacter coli]
MKLFKNKEGLDVQEELLGWGAQNPFITNDSASRSYMSASQVKQILTLVDGDDKIIQTGIEKQMGRNTFNRILDHDYRLVKKITRYRGIGASAINKTVGYLLIVENLDNGELDYIDVPYQNTLHPNFGFKYVWNEDMLETMTTGDILPKETKLAVSPTLKDNAHYKYGLNANLALLSFPATSKDGAVISESFAERLSYDYFQTFVIDTGSKSFPLNLYGDKDNYKPFPEIGELVRDDSVLIALRSYDDMFTSCLTSVNDVREFNPLFDKATYVRSPGGKEIVNGDERLASEVVDIKVWHAPKAKKEPYSGTCDILNKYAESLKMYYKNILNTYEAKLEEHHRLTGNYNLKISRKLHRLVAEAYAIVNPDNKKINYTFRNEPIDIYRIEITLKTRIPRALPGMKISDAGHGSKAVIVKIVPDKDMPVDKNGNRADIIMEPGSVVNRMNPGRVYEQYIAGMSRKCQYLITSKYGKDISKYTEDMVNDSYNIILGLVKILDTEQYDAYNRVTDINTKLEIVKEAIEKEVYLYYKVSSKKKPYEIVNEAKDTIYRPCIDTYTFKEEGKEFTSIHPCCIAPVYTILINKTSENFLAASAVRLNHFFIPISVGNNNKYSLPYKLTLVKNCSETEGRLFGGYATSSKALAELKDRANNPDTLKIMYSKLLRCDNPATIHTLIDRRTYPYGGDAALAFMRKLINSAGIDFMYVPDKNK